MLSLTPHLRPAMAGAALLLLGGLAQAQQVAIDLQTAGLAATAGGTLANGVTWDVNAGGGWVANAAGGYYQYRPSADGVQTFTFSIPVDLEFGVTDLQNANEGVTLPAGTSCTVPATATGITWNPATFTLQNGNTGNTNGSNHVFACTLNGVTTLTLDGNGMNPGVRRGLNYLRVTPTAATMTPTFGNVPGNLATGATATGVTLTCTNTGPGTATNASCAPTATAGGTISNLSCTPASPAATLTSGSSIVCTFDVSATAAAGGNVALEGTTAANNAPAVAPATASIPVATAAAANVQAVPTLHFWGLLLMSALLGLGGAIGKRHRG
ncbi:MAG: IPTL-CTERM sorting domain-containing protein [Pseudomonadota bacterium]|nr:IPTL-CTERM sorting domain-containing protein [Pseudomonadota bacterium]